MPQCPFCDHRNPPSAESCEKCGGPLSAVRRPRGGSLEEQLRWHLDRGEKSDAISLYREQTGSDLKDALRAVDALAARHGIATKGTGCAGAMLVIFAAAWAAARFVLGI